MDANRKERNMKKQYRIVERHWPYYHIILYHDGIELATKDSNQMMIGQDTDKLEDEGYTYGYTDKEIEEARKKYEHRLENRIGPEVETYEGEWIDVPDCGGGWYVDGKQIYPKSCSICGDVYTKIYKYCPNCGAKMKGVK